MKSAFMRLEAGLGWVMRTVTVASLTGLFVAVGFVVANRTIGVRSTGWTDELIELLFAWLIFAGAASLWRERGHFAVDLAVQVMPEGMAKQAVKTLAEGLCLVFLWVFFYQSLVFIANATDDSPVFAISKVYWYGVMPIAAAIMMGYSIVRFVRLLLSLFRGKPAHARSAA